ncbi:MAG: hypothetical protein A2979_06195 [Deltaproteobacteria bacterium RIFCSPLOWO2_01_FULL_45_74]|nr:MAG: hypothetical protein A2712_00445 [Deltaproteobacteria bacterium RIFCSPHIGHO2_01_FULL_43_49]OGQ14256.1 MAG: hypothetical protein A3D22_10170 [Deltaproteobacteria bacterium RIFCSPHIGHO2_02_FULL_44_53]OGQ27472.1 MAG: hypothetical protein A3D98_03770 [Deltaproteobacteria bacterium RIFCSPHIGHO2_12_FULL_44_21]OGQ30720.1 MAG: hypothetical protein A2979_06195 [Deltaproteobacteria bacterium RIFCSPLOWO2_01_FULL_45_74]OGQ42397.1 MAG: hypothetical protein A3I70_02680 [Deltaproteobacteria bacterium 
MQNGNLTLQSQDINLPGVLPMGLSTSFNAGIGDMVLEKFWEVFDGALPHTVIQTRLDGQNMPVIGNVDRIVYDNTAVDLGAVGLLKAFSTGGEHDRSYNEITLRAGNKGWNVAWSNYVGALLLLNVSPNASQRPAIVLLINKDGGAEPFDFSTGESLWDKTGSKFVNPFGSTIEEIERLDVLRLVDPENVAYQFQKTGSGELPYTVYYSYPCDRWEHFSAGVSIGIPLFSFTRKTCHANFRLTGWKIFGFQLKRIEDAQGHFVETNVFKPSPGIPQTITDESGRTIALRALDNGLEEWEAPGVPDASGQRPSRAWQVQWDGEHRITSMKDPEGNANVYNYDWGATTQCPMCLFPKRSLGWNSLQEPKKFLEIRYPTGGIMRYEWYGEEERVGEEQAGHNRFVIITEFPDPADRTVFYQKYHWVNEVTQSPSAEGGPAITSVLYDLDGSVKENFFHKISESWRQVEERLSGNGLSIVKRFSWSLNPDEKTVDGISKVEVTQNGVTYVESERNYDSLGRLASVVEPSGLHTEYEYVGGEGEQKNLVSKISKSGESASEVVRYVYGGRDVCGRGLKNTQLNYTFMIVNGEEQILKKHCYDHQGQVIRELDGKSYALQAPLQIALDSAAVPPEGTEQIVYDRVSGLLLKEVDDHGVSRRYIYNKVGALTRIDFSGGSFVKHDYDVSNRTITTTFHDTTTNKDVSFFRRFDGLGNLIEENQGGAVTRYTYTPEKQLSQMAYPDGRFVQYTYDALGRILTQNLSGHQPLQYNYSMRLSDGAPLSTTQVSVGNEKVLKVENDLNGNPVLMEKYDRDGSAVTTQYSYDPLGNLLNVTTPLGLNISDSIDYSSGRVNRTFPGGDRHQMNLYESQTSGSIAHLDAAGNSVRANLNFASNGLLQDIAYPSGHNIRLSYGADRANRGRLTQIEDKGGHTRFAYNAGGGAEMVERHIDTLNTDYTFYQVRDAFSNLVRLIYPNGLIVYYKYDEQNRVSEVRKDSERGLLLAKIDYAADDQPIHITYANGVVNEYAYDTAGRLVRIDARKKDGTFIQQDQYLYDQRGRKISVQHLDGSKITYEYDGLSRLIASRYFKKGEATASQFQEYTYDHDGNRIRYKDSLKEIHYTYEEGQLVGYEIRQGEDAIWQGTVEYALGNIVSQRETRGGEVTLEKRFEYDPQHRLVAAHVQDNKNKFETDSKYQYDYTGRRQQATVDGKTTYYLYGEALDPLMEAGDNGEVKAFYIFVGGRRLAKIEGDELDFYHSDEMDNVLKMSDVDGNVVQTVRYDPFGNINFLNGSDHNPFLFAGKPYDQATGLYYFGARYYDPTLGRFLSRDPLLQGTNHYVYAMNNPIGVKDIYGLWGFHLDLGINFDFKKGLVPGASLTFTAGKFSLGINATTLLTGGAGSLANNFASSLFGSIDLGPIKLGGNFSDLTRNGLKSFGSSIASSLMNSFKIPGPLGKYIRPFQMGLSYGVGKGLDGFRFQDMMSGKDLFGLEGVLNVIKNPGKFLKKLNFDVGALLNTGLKNVVSKIDGFHLLAIGQRILTKDFTIYDFAGAVASRDPYSKTNGNEQPSDEESTDVDRQEIASNFQEADSATRPAEVAGNKPNNTNEEPVKAVFDKEASNANADNTTDPILLHSGDLLQTNTDLKIPGRGPSTGSGQGLDFEFTRTYRSRITFDGPLGFNWDHNYNKRLVLRDDGNVARFDGQARFDIYVKNADGNPSTGSGQAYTSPAGYFDTLIVAPDPADSKKMLGAIIKDKHSTENVYGADGYITQIKDRNGNTMRFEYNSVLSSEFKVLSSVTDTVGRKIEYTYNSSGNLTEIKDFSGRTIQFNYSQQGDLISVTNPAGQTMRYTYSSGYLDDREELNHNILTVVDAKGQTYLKNTYSIYDRVIKQTFGDEGAFLIEYNQVASSLECTPDLIDKVFYRTNVIDRIGNKIDYVFNCQGNPLQIIRYTRGVRAGDPAKFITQYAYNKDGLLTKQTNPKGNAIQYEYDAKGNLLVRRQLPVTGSNDAPLATTFTYDPQFSQLTKVTDPLSHVTTFKADEKGNITQKCLPELSTSNLELRTQLCETYTYNDHGQIASITDGEGNVDTYTYNDKGQLEQITRDAGNGRLNLTNQFGYDAVGNINSFTDGRGNAFVFEVNALNQVTREIFPSFVRRGEGEVDSGVIERNIEYDANNNVVRISGNAAVETRFTYNILDRVTTKRETIDGVRIALTEYQYDLNENLTRIVQPEGNSTCVSHDERNLSYQVTKGCKLPEASTQTFNYDSNGNVSFMKDGNGNVIAYQYDGFNRLKKIADPLKGEMIVAYDEVSNITSITRRGPPDGLGTSNLELRTQFVYDTLNRLVQKTEENGDADAVIKYAYDKNNRLTELRKLRTSNLELRTQFVYDGADRLIQKTDALGNETKYIFDGNGNVAEQLDIELGTSNLELRTQFSYDPLNRLVNRTNNAGHKYTYEYDSRNNLITSTDPKDKPGLDDGATTSQGNKVKYSYDGLNRLIEEVKELTNTGAGDGAVTDTVSTRYGYDDNGRLTEITDANNHATRFAYDALNHQVEVKLHNNQTYTKRYDRNSNLIEEIQPNGFKVASIYDALNRLTNKEITLRGSPAGRETFAYDALSRMISAQNADPFGDVIGNVAFGYDSLSRVVSESINSRSITKEYDGVGNVTKRTYPSGRVVDSAYDSLNRLTAIQQTPTASGILETIFGADTVNILNAAYIGKDRPQSFTFGNNTKTEFAYDSLKRLTSLNLELRTQNLERFSYGYDKSGNRLFETRTSNLEPRTSNVFSYDSLYRLVSAKNQVPSPTAEIANPGSMPFSVSNQWTLDGVDNWLEKVRTVASDSLGTSNIELRTQFTPNEVNAYTNVDGTPYIYDENGNLIDDVVHTYQYNYRNLLTRIVSKVDGTEVASYGYDALGRRIFKTVDGQTSGERSRTMTRYVYEGVHIVAEINSDDSIAKEFIYGSTSLTTSGNSIDDPIVMLTQNLELRTWNAFYYHTDGLGSVVSLTDSEGQITETYKYGAYGEVEIYDGGGALLEDSAAGNPFLYTGQMYDAETGFYYYKARYYHPTLGRFLQRDPLGYIDGYNLYSYVNNNPLNWIDPLGFAKNKSDGQQISMTGNVDELLGTDPRPGQVYLFTHGGAGPITKHIAVETEPDFLTWERQVYSADETGTYMKPLRVALRYRSGEIYYPNQSFDIQKLTQYAEQNKGIPYDYANLANVVNSPYLDNPTKEICSSAVASCLSAAGVKFQNHGFQITPGELAHDPALTKIGEFKYGGWGVDREGLQNFVNEHFQTPVDFIPPPMGGI